MVPREATNAAPAPDARSERYGMLGLLYTLAAGLLLAVALGASIRAFMAARREPLAFDDAYMFLRYAHNLRHGLGYSWNLDGVHTFGPTSLLWSATTVLLSFLPTDAWAQLLTGSWLCSMVALVAIAWAVAANAGSRAMQKTYRVLPLVALPLVATPVFEANQFTGMETMLGMALCACFAGAALQWARGERHSALLGTLAFLLYLARPEAALVGLLLPLGLWLLQNREDRRPPLLQLAVAYAVFLGLTALQLAACRLYFGTPVPLSVYMKGGHAYAGYRGVWHPELLLLAFLAACQVYLAAAVLLVRRRDLRMLLAFAAPAVAVFLYLQTVTQIMGFQARYYVPYTPLLVIPALLLIDRRIADGTLPSSRSLRARSALVAALLLTLLVTSSEAVQEKIRHMEGRHRDEYDAARLTVTAREPLPPLGWHAAMTAITDLLIAPLPRGATVAATEVGYLGERAGHVNVIDLAGLNDTSIALHGFSMQNLLLRRPDLIWMPNSDYTYQRGVIFSEPALLSQYDVYADAAKYGIAIRKDSPFRAQMQERLTTFWASTYPGTRMEDYRVQSVTWSGQKHTVRGE